MRSDLKAVLHDQAFYFGLWRRPLAAALAHIKQRGLWTGMQVHSGLSAPYHSLN